MAKKSKKQSKKTEKSVEKKLVMYKNIKALLKASRTGTLPKKIIARADFGDIIFLAPTGAKKKAIMAGEAESHYTVLSVAIPDLIPALLKSLGVKVKFEL